MRKETLSPRQAAQRLGTTLFYIYQELWANRLTGARKEGKTWRIPAKEVARRVKTRESRNE